MNEEEKKLPLRRGSARDARRFLVKPLRTRVYDSAKRGRSIEPQALVRRHSEVNLMREVLVVVGPSASESERKAVMGAAPAAQMISDRVFTSTAGDAAVARLRSMAGVSAVLTGGEPVQSLPQLTDAEMLFAQAWLSRTGQIKQRRGDGLDWDTPPMTPPDPPRQK